MRVTVDAAYHVHITGQLDLPEGRTWFDVEDYTVHWYSIRVKYYDDSTWHEYNYVGEERENLADSRPLRVAILSEDGQELAKEELA
jgi:hypothetical protein